MEAFDPFAVLGLPRRYDVDAGALESAYLERSASLHPDLLGVSGWSQIGNDAETGRDASELNRARQMLEDPEQRAMALWKLWGGGSGGDGDDRALPPGFLIEMMEIRQEIEALQAGGGRLDPAELQRWETWAADRRRGHEESVAERFARLSPGSKQNADVLRQIKLELNAWRYIERLVEQLAE